MILYKPEVGESCCPAYTIRLKVDCMEKSNEHVRVMRRMQRFEVSKSKKMYDSLFS